MILSFSTVRLGAGIDLSPCRDRAQVVAKGPVVAMARQVRLAGGLALGMALVGKWLGWLHRLVSQNLLGIRLIVLI